MKNKFLFVLCIFSLFTLPLINTTPFAIAQPRGFDAAQNRLLNHFRYTSKDDDFDLFMGKNTSHFQNVQSQEDFAFLQACKESYQKNVKLLKVHKQEVKIPKIVHFIWLGPRPFPPHSVENVRTWMAKNPDWTFKFWTDRDRIPPCNGMERHFVQDFSFKVLASRFEDSKNFGEKSDILRYEILFQEGGVYVDHDANCLRPFDDLHSAFDFYCCLEAPHPLMAGHRITCGNGVIGSKAGHPVVGKILSTIDQRWDALAQKFRGKDKYAQAEIVLNRTYIALTKSLECLNKDGNVDIVLPASYFFAKGGMKPIYSKHFFANAWADHSDAKLNLEKDVEKQLGKIRQKSARMTYFNYLALALNVGILLIIVYYLYRKQKYGKKI